MAEGRFYRYELRTTDVDAARAFYANVFGAEFWRSGVDVVPLPARAAARGAPAHWLGHIGPGDIEETVRRIVTSGGQQLGPAEPGAGASIPSVLRDPFGAVIALGGETAALRHSPVAWHLLHAHDHERAFAFYAALFGWTPNELLDQGPEMGHHRLFAWDDSGKSAGSVANTARLPGVHPHWLFYFCVPELAPALARVRASGGKGWEAIRTPSGDVASLCEDPQGAAFGLYQFATDVS